VDLINRLGGYEKAKATLLAEQQSENIDPVFYLNGQEILIDVLDDALLQYRQEHGMFDYFYGGYRYYDLTTLTQLKEMK